MHPKEIALDTQEEYSTRQTCTCGAPADIYADDERTPLCGKCWWAIYGKDAGNER
jgi:hypothetical protein